MLRRLVIQLCLLAFCLTSPTIVVAQRVRGTVRDSASASPAPGVVLTLLDSTGRTAARTISDEQGQYSLPLASGLSRLRAMRIGFHPRELAINRKPGEADVTLDIVMPR